MLRIAIARFAPLRRRKPPCFGFPSFPGFRRRASGSGLFPLSSPASGCRLFPVSAAVPWGPVFSRFHRPHRVAVFPLSSPVPDRIGSHRVVPRTLLRASAFPRSGKPFLRQSHCAVARLFPNFACLQGASPPLFRVRYAVSHIALLAKEGESPVTDPPPRSIVCAGRITPPAGSRES